MADLTLYTMADPEILAGALRGIAMVFDPTTSEVWVSSGGLGLGAVAGVGLLITLLIMLFKAIMTQKLEIWTFLIMMVVYAMAFVPKTTLQVERLQDGQIEMVDGIPFGVALPAALMSGMMKAVTENFELAFSDPRVGTYSETGFMDPLKTLMGMRNVLGTAGGNGHLRSNFAAFVQKCMVDAETGEEVDLTEVLRKGGALDSLFDPLTLKGGFVELRQPAGTGYLKGYYSCKDEGAAGFPSAATLLRQQVTTYITPLNATKPIGLEADLRQEVGTKEVGGATFTAKEDLERSITTLAGAAIINQDVAIQDLVIGSLIRESGKFASIQDPTRMAETMEMTRALEAWKVDSSASGSMFLKTMQSSMDIMLFVWIALAPILAMTMIISGLAGLKMMAQFFMFGIWTQSWMPFAMVINYYMQMTISGQLEKKLMPGADIQSLFAVGYQDALYNEIGMSIATASQLLAFTPVLSLAILTGSYMALTNLGTAMSGKDGYFDEKKLAADGGIATGGQNIANQNHNLGYAAHESAGIMGGAGSANLAYTHAGKGVLSSQNAMAASQGIATQASSEASAAASAGFNKMFGMNQAHMQNYRQVLQSQFMTSDGLSDTKLSEYLKGFTKEDTSGLSAEKKLDLATQLTFAASLGAKAQKAGKPGKVGEEGSAISKMLSAFAGAGFDGAIKSSAGDSDAYKNVLSAGMKDAFTNRDTQQKAHQVLASRGNTDSKETSGSITKSLNEASQYGDTYVTKSAMARRAQEDVSRNASAGITYQQPMAQLAQMAAARNASERPGSGGKVQGDQLQQLMAAAKPEEWGAEGAAAMQKFQQQTKNGDWAGVADGVRSLMSSNNHGDKAMGFAMAAEFIEMAGAPKDLADQYRNQAGLQKDFAKTYDARMAAGGATEQKVDDETKKIKGDVDKGGKDVKGAVGKEKKAVETDTGLPAYNANVAPMDKAIKATQGATEKAGTKLVQDTKGAQILSMTQSLDDSMAASVQNQVVAFDKFTDSLGNVPLGILNGAYGSFQMGQADGKIQGNSALLQEGQAISGFAAEAQQAGGFDKLSPERQGQITAAMDRYTSAYQDAEGGLMRFDGGTSAGDFDGNQGDRLAGVAKHFRNNQGEFRQNLQDAQRDRHEGAHRLDAGDTQAQRGVRQWNSSDPLMTPGANFAIEYGSGNVRYAQGTPSALNVESVGSGEFLEHLGVEEPPAVDDSKGLPRK